MLRPNGLASGSGTEGNQRLSVNPSCFLFQRQVCRSCCPTRSSRCRRSRWPSPKKAPLHRSALCSPSDSVAQEASSLNHGQEVNWKRTASVHDEHWTFKSSGRCVCRCTKDKLTDFPTTAAIPSWHAGPVDDSSPTFSAASDFSAPSIRYLAVLLNCGACWVRPDVWRNRPCPRSDVYVIRITTCSCPVHAMRFGWLGILMLPRWTTSPWIQHQVHHRPQCCYEP